MRVLAIDPGTTESAYIMFDGKKDPKDCDAGKIDNHELLLAIDSAMLQRYQVVIEKIECFGMAVGASVFETAYWIGRFIERAKHSFEAEVSLMPRREVKIHLCGTMKAKDGNIRQALIDKYGEQGKKKTPGPTYGFKADMWSALAIATTFVETRRK